MCTTSQHAHALPKKPTGINRIYLVPVVGVEESIITPIHYKWGILVRIKVTIQHNLPQAFHLEMNVLLLPQYILQHQL